MRRAGPLLAAAVAVALVLPAWRAAIATVSVLALFAVTAIETVWALSSGTRGRRDFTEIRPRVHELQRPPDLESLERTFGWKTYSRRDFDHRVRPLLVRLIEHRLIASRGITLAKQPLEARAALPEELRALIDGATPSSAADPVTTARIARLLDAIEAI
jgi:hypothetical protein